MFSIFPQLANVNQLWGCCLGVSVTSRTTGTPSGQKWAHLTCLLDSLRWGSAQKSSCRDSAPTSTSWQETSSQPSSESRWTWVQMLFLSNKIRHSCQRSWIFTPSHWARHTTTHDLWQVDEVRTPHLTGSSMKTGSAWYPHLCLSRLACTQKVLEGGWEWVSSPVNERHHVPALGECGI